jgi:4-nitrophenyl phosphatase
MDGDGIELSTWAATKHKEIKHEIDALARLPNAKAWIFDMDGVLYRGTEPLPGVSELLALLQQRGRQYMLATNNSMSTAAAYVQKLATMGIDVPAEAILTSAMATRGYLLKEFTPKARFLVIGMPALAEQLFWNTEFGPSGPGDGTPAAVVVGLDRVFTYEKLAAAHAAIMAGARFIATNTDATLPTESGLVPGCGSIVAAIETAADTKPVVIGKPEPLMLQIALAQMDVAPEDAVMIGDRLDTDILAGNRAGMLTVLVLTGVSTREEIASAPAWPDLVFTDLNAVLETLTNTN